MTKDVLISISGLQFEVNSEEPVEVVSVGEYYERNGKRYLVYEEMQMDDVNSREMTKNTIKIAKNQVDIIKKGTNNVHMIFELNKKNITYYNTPYGDLLIGLYTTALAVSEEEEEITLNLDYVLSINSNHVSDCKITIKITPRR